MQNGIKVGINLTRPATVGVGIANLLLADGISNLLLAGTSDEVLLLAS